MASAFCRCGAKPAVICPSCHETAGDDGYCRKHKSLKCVNAQCDDCHKLLCWWHFVHDVGGRLHCMPSCQHDLKGNEVHPFEFDLPKIAKVGT